MNMRSTLILMAATVAPLCAQAQEAPAALSTTQQLLAQAANPTVAPATPEQRAAVFNALALLPPTVSDVVVLPNISENCAKLDKNLRHELELPEGIDNAAIATTPASPATYALVACGLQGYRAMTGALSLSMTGMATGSKPELFPTIMEQMMAGTAASLESQYGAAVNGPVNIPTSFAVLTCKPGHEAQLQELHTRLLQELQRDIEPEDGQSAVQDVNGWSGVCQDLAKPMAKLKEQLEKEGAEQPQGFLSMTGDKGVEKLMPIIDELAKHKLQIVSRVQGTALVIALCEDPQEVKLAATPAESVLGTDLLACCDANLGKGMIFAARTSPQLDDLYETASTDYLYNIADGLGSVFTKLGELDAANKAGFDKAAAGIGLLTKTMRSLTPTRTQPTTIQAWHDGDLHITASTDARGASYTKGTLRLAAAGDAPATAFYMESTPAAYGELSLPTGQELVDAVLDVTAGFSLTLDEQKKAEVQQGLALAQAFMPELNAAMAATATIGSGLDGHCALILDSAHAPMPAFTGAAEGAEADVPRLGMYLGIADRAKLAQGWDALMATAAQVAAKTGQDPAALGQLPVLVSQKGALTSYTAELPLTTPDCVPNLTVSDTGLAFGTSANLNAQLVESATGDTTFAGGVMSLKFAPMAKSLRSLSLALDPTPEEAEPVAAAEVEVPSEEAECETCVASEDGMCDECYTKMMAEAETASCCQQEKAAASMAEAAAILEEASQVVNGVNVTSTIENGLHTLKINVDFK